MLSFYILHGYSDHFQGSTILTFWLFSFTPLRPVPRITHHPALMGFVCHSPFLCIMITVMMLTGIFATTNTSATAGVTHTATSAATTTERDNHDRV